MASKVTSGDGGVDRQMLSSPFLPRISSAERRSLPSSAPDRPSSAAIKVQASKWAADIRERTALMQAQGTAKPVETADEVSRILKQEITAIFIRALHRKDRQSWIFLVEALSLMEPHRDLLISRPELHHYAESLPFHGGQW
jgi:hypothetical protein